MIVVKRQEALHQVLHPRLPLRDARKQCSCHLRPVSGPLDELGDSLLKTDPSIVSKPTSVVMGAMKSLAVIVVATGVMRACSHAARS